MRKVNWPLTLLGGSMLGIAVIAGVMLIASAVGLLKALVACITGALAAAWTIVGVILLVMGLNKGKEVKR